MIDRSDTKCPNGARQPTQRVEATTKDIARGEDGRRQAGPRFTYTALAEALAALPRRVA